MSPDDQLTILDLYNIKNALDKIMTDRHILPVLLRQYEHTLGKIQRLIKEYEG